MAVERALLIIGPRHSGISTALAACNHYGWQTFGNVPLEQVPPLLENSVGTIALATTGHPTPEQLQTWLERFPGAQGLFLEAPLATLTLRASLSDVPHPGLSSAQTTEGALAAELQQLLPLKKHCVFTLNTGDFTPDAFRYKIGQILGYANAKPPALSLSLWSFGFKYGIPLEANWVLDVRFIPNPFYVPELRPLTGMDAAIQDYVLQHPEAAQFVTHTTSLISTALPHYPTQGIDKLVVAIGCTGGKHRSVTLVETIAHQLQQSSPGLNVQIFHREQAGWGINRPALTAIG